MNTERRTNAENKLTGSRLGAGDTGGMASSVLKALTGYQGAHSLKHLCGGNAITVYVTDVIKKQFYVSEW